jgi:pilus assembly protein CpaF
MQEIFGFERKGLGPNGEIKGSFRATGIRPKFTEKLVSVGCRLRMDLFESRLDV